MRAALFRCGSPASAERGGVTVILTGGEPLHRRDIFEIARQGTKRAPQHVGGGTVFGPTPRSYRISVPKRVRRGALRSAVSLRSREEQIIVLDKFELGEIKTRGLVDVLGVLDADRALIVEHKDNVNLSLSARNLPRCKVLPPEGVNVYDVLNHEQLIFTEQTAKDLEARLTPRRA